jgi:hypothetical protein
MRPKLKLSLATVLTLAVVLSVGLVWLNSRAPQPRARADLAAREIQFPPPPIFPGVTIPTQIYSCIESDLAGVDLWGKTKDGDQQVYLLGLYRSYSRSTNPLTPITVQEGLIQLGKAGCQRLAGLDSVQKPLTEYVSQSAALDLEKQRFTHFATLLGGSQQLRNALATYQKDYRLSSEAVTALAQMNIRVPNYLPLQSTTFEQN